MNIGRQEEERKKSEVIERTVYPYWFPKVIVPYVECCNENWPRAMLVFRLFNQVLATVKRLPRPWAIFSFCFGHCTPFGNTNPQRCKRRRQSFFPTSFFPMNYSLSKRAAFFFHFSYNCDRHVTPTHTHTTSRFNFMPGFIRKGCAIIHQFE